MFNTRPFLENIFGSAAYDFIKRAIRIGGPVMLTVLFAFNEWFRTAPPLIAVAFLICVLFICFDVIYILLAYLEKRFMKKSNLKIIVPVKYGNNPEAVLTKKERILLLVIGIISILGLIGCIVAHPKSQSQNAVNQNSPLTTNSLSQAQLQPNISTTNPPALVVGATSNTEPQADNFKNPSTADSTNKHITNSTNVTVKNNSENVSQSVGAGNSGNVAQLNNSPNSSVNQ